MLLTSEEYLKNIGDPDREKIREFISGNFCRCTGYEAIVDAVERVARERGKQKNG
jgi:carbon-monoxide dehydrogenase small subunit